MDLLNFLVGLVCGGVVVYAYARRAFPRTIVLGKPAKITSGPWARRYVVTSINVREGFYDPGAATVELQGMESFLSRATVVNRSST